MISFSVDPKGLNELKELATGVSRLERQAAYLTARAMTQAAIAAKEKLSSDVLGRIRGGATTWTRRGLIVTYAKPTNLQTYVGWQYGGGDIQDSGRAQFKGGGVPSGRYMENLARGGDRQPKSTELQLRRAGLIGASQFIVPATKSNRRGGIRVDARGNVSGPEYQKILSRLRSITTEGSDQNTVQLGSRGRSAGKRRQSDYFLMRYEGGRPSRWQLGADPVYIAKRAGRGQRGYVPALFITDAPNYEKRFPIKSIALREYQRVFPSEWRKAVMNEIVWQRKR